MRYLVLRHDRGAAFLVWPARRIAVIAVPEKVKTEGLAADSPGDCRRSEQIREFS